MKRAAHRNDSQRESTARFVPPSAPQGPSVNVANSKKIYRKKKSKSAGTSSQGRRGTSRPTTASTVEDIHAKGVSACDVDRILSGLQSLLSAVRCPTKCDSPQLDRQGVGSYESSVHDEDAREHELGNEDESPPPESSGHRRDAPKGPSAASAKDYDWFPAYEEVRAYVASASTDDAHAPLHECLKVVATNPANGAGRKVTVFFDSGSTFSYISPTLARDLDLHFQGKCVLRVNTFGTPAPTTVKGFSTSVVLRSPQGRQVSLRATTADFAIPSVRTALVEDADLPLLRRNERNLSPTEVAPDILIGQDRIHLFARHHGTQLPAGFDVVHTILGPTIGGAPQVVSNQPKAGSSSPSETVVSSTPTPSFRPSLKADNHPCQQNEPQGVTTSSTLFAERQALLERTERMPLDTARPPQSGLHTIHAVLQPGLHQGRLLAAEDHQQRDRHLRVSEQMPTALQPGPLRLSVDPPAHPVEATARARDAVPPRAVHARVSPESPDVQFETLYSAVFVSADPTMTDDTSNAASPEPSDNSTAVDSARDYNLHHQRDARLGTHYLSRSTSANDADSSRPSTSRFGPLPIVDSTTAEANAPQHLAHNSRPSASRFGPLPIVDSAAAEAARTGRCASPLDVSDSTKRQNTPDPTAGTHADEKPSIFWSASRSLTNSDSWTRRRTLPHSYHSNPLDAELEQENAIPSPDVDRPLRPEDPFKTDEPLPPTDPSSQGQPPRAGVLQEILPYPVPKPCPAVAESSSGDFFSFLSIFRDAVDGSCHRVSQRTFPSSATPTFKRRGSRHENLRTVPTTSSCERNAITGHSAIDRTPRNDAGCLKNCSGPLPSTSLIFSNNYNASGENSADLRSCTVASHFAVNFAVPEKHPEMASGKKDDSPTGDLQLWCNIDDDESEQNPYIQPARSRSASNERKPWSGTPQSGPLPTAGSTATEAVSSSQGTASQKPVDSQFGPLPTADDTGSEATAMPKDPAMETTESHSGPLPNEDAVADAATSATISTSFFTEQLIEPRSLKYAARKATTQLAENCPALLQDMPSQLNSAFAPAITEVWSSAPHADAAAKFAYAALVPVARADPLDQGNNVFRVVLTTTANSDSVLDPARLPASTTHCAPAEAPLLDTKTPASANKQKTPVARRLPDEAASLQGDSIRVHRTIRDDSPLKNETVCFCDGSTFLYFGCLLRPEVLMILTPMSTLEGALRSVCDFHPSNEVRRVIFWLGDSHATPLSPALQLRLVIELSCHYATQYKTVKQYVVATPTIGSRQDVWTCGLFKLLVQMQVVLPHAHVIMSPRGSRSVTHDDVCHLKRYLRDHYHLNLWSCYEADVVQFVEASYAPQQRHVMRATTTVGRSADEAPSTTRSQRRRMLNNAAATPKNGTTDAAMHVAPVCPSSKKGSRLRDGLRDGSAAQPVAQFPPPPSRTKFHSTPLSAQPPPTHVRKLKSRSRSSPARQATTAHSRDEAHHRSTEPQKPAAPVKTSKRPVGRQPSKSRFGPLPVVDKAVAATAEHQVTVRCRRDCAFCDLSHFAAKCFLYRSRTKRVWRAKELGYCFFCLRTGHARAACPYRTNAPCQLCKRGQHHRALCPLSSSTTSAKQASRRLTLPSTGASESATTTPVLATKVTKKRRKPNRSARSTDAPSAALMPPTPDPAEARHRRIARKRQDREPRK